ncbi:MAG: HD family hydrolase [Acidobacteriota bacterium]|nr:HD family hydrolase [Acidobacteriota bacterium]
MNQKTNAQAAIEGREYSIWLTLSVKTDSLSGVAAESSKTIVFLTELMRLKAVPRTGWLLRGVRDVESVADHSFGVAFIAMLLADLAEARGMELNIEKVLRMALLHDLTEARTGDLPATIKRYFDPAMLHAMDERIADEMLAGLGAIGKQYLLLWREYEERLTLESRIVKAADKLDLLLQAQEYEKGGARGLQEFWANSETDFSALDIDDLIVDLIEGLIQSRKSNDDC